MIFISGSDDARQLITSIQNAALNDREIQTLIETLLNRQSGAEQSSSIESWNKVILVILQYCYGVVYQKLVTVSFKFCETIKKTYSLDCFSQ